MAQANATRIGAFVLGGVALLVAVVVGFGSGAWLAPSAERSIVVAESVQGLQVGAPVTYNGVVVGEVVAIGARLAVDEAEIVNGLRVRLHSSTIVADRGDVSVSEIVDRLVDRGMRAQLAIQSVVTAALYIRFVNAPDVEPYAAPDEFLGAPTIPAIPSDMARFGQLAQTIGADLPATLARIGDVADAVAQTLNDDNRAAFGEALAGIAAFAATLEAAGPDIAAAAADARTAVASLPRTAAALGDLVAALDATVQENRGRIGEIADSLATASAAAAAASAQVEAMVQENRAGLRSFTREGLAEVWALAVEAQSMVRAVERVARRLETEGAGSLLGGESLPECRPRGAR